MARHRDDLVERLAIAAAEYGNRSVARRLGVIVERMIGADAAQMFMPISAPGKDTIELEPLGSAPGTIDSRWRVRVSDDAARLMGEVASK